MAIDATIRRAISDEAERQFPGSFVAQNAFADAQLDAYSTIQSYALKIGHVEQFVDLRRRAEKLFSRDYSNQAIMILGELQAMMELIELALGELDALRPMSRFARLGDPSGARPLQVT